MISVAGTRHLLEPIIRDFRIIAESDLEDEDEVIGQLNGLHKRYSDNREDYGYIFNYIGISKYGFNSFGSSKFNGATFGRIRMIGSGQMDFVTKLEEVGKDVGPNETFYDTMLHVFAEAISRQLMSGHGIVNRWGGPIEVIYREKDRFRVVDNVLVRCWKVRKRHLNLDAMYFHSYRGDDLVAASGKPNEPGSFRIARASRLIGSPSTESFWDEVYFPSLVLDSIWTEDDDGEFVHTATTMAYPANFDNADESFRKQISIRITENRLEHYLSGEHYNDLVRTINRKR
jgi:hypothetical protein